jgi:stage II sporulation protein E
MRIKKENIRMENILSDYSRTKLHCLSKTYEELARLYRIDNEAGIEQGGDRKDIFYIKQLLDTRNVFADQLYNVSEAFADVADTQVRITTPLEHKRRALISYLRKNGISVREVIFLGNDRITIEAKTIGKSSLSASVLGKLLSEFFARKLVTASGSALTLYRGYGLFIYEEEPRFNLLSSVSRATKDNEKVSGDNFSLEEYNQKDAVLMISDGIGSGKCASHDSAKAIEFVERLLEAGFTAQKAFSMVNSAVISQNTLVPIDICSIDLMDGGVEFIKAGAATSFIKRGKRVDIILSESLPLGSREGISPIIQATRLTENDMLIMVSDGVTDAVGMASLREFISRSNALKPRELSDMVLRHAINCQKGHIRDDMTVIIAMITKNNPF